MNRILAFILLLVITFNTIRYVSYIINGPIAAYYFVMLAINLAGLGLGIYYLFFQKRKRGRRS
ncbi:hypothetical protein [Sutcliffiella rhizosphaerae]|uniref:Uncharacterized protein n=1 Tax=Sutcliffiella rhizosphaerae TaxID=2880967 RepID=A0ABM8YU98_9BACI|nr:hypothetical protein [Sutcliffiella rhizosphaerae]CAG9623529.1 hypothetical protein BACCIP111883_04345 [Sutcliffiella rhizosphaerae]